MSCNIVFVGGGSFLWTGRFATDLFLKPSMRGSRLVLVDVDTEARDLMVDYCRLLNDRLSAGWTIEAAPLDEALIGADYVMVSISTGGLDAFERDYTIPEKYGVYHSVGDTVGPSGISRVLRNVPVFVDIAQRMERICPNAWMIHVTNPLAQLTRCVARTSSVKVMGLCHNFEGTRRFFSNYLGAKHSEIHANTFGVNHFTWLQDLTCKGEPVDPQRLSVKEYLRYEARRREPQKSGTTDDEINEMLQTGLPEDERLSFELFELFGYFPVGGPPHVAENFPYFLNDPKTVLAHRIRRKGVLPYRLDGREKKRARVRRMIEGTESLDPLVQSHEDLAHIIESLHTGHPCRAVVNLPNRGQIENLPRDVVVETWADIGRDRVTPLPAGPVPVVLKGLLESIIAEEELAVEAALTGDRRLVVQAMFISPMLHNKDAAEAITDELLAAQQAHLPQFQLPATRRSSRSPRRSAKTPRQPAVAME